MARVRLGISIEKLFVFTWRDILSTADNQILHSPDDKHLADRITADDLANLIDTSVGRLFRAFRRFTTSHAEDSSSPALDADHTRASLPHRFNRRLFRPNSLLPRLQACSGATPAAWRRVNRAYPQPRAGESRESISPSALTRPPCTQPRRRSVSALHHNAPDGATLGQQSIAADAY
jgi:hypothetical protein